jgi:hypothetical protein
MCCIKILLSILFSISNTISLKLVTHPLESRIAYVYCIKNVNNLINNIYTSNKNSDFYNTFILYKDVYKDTIYIYHDTAL